MCDYEYKSLKRYGSECPYSEYGSIEVNDKVYCIFHAPIEYKDKYRFNYALYRLIEEFKDIEINEWDFEGFVFPRTNFFHKFVFSAQINFKSCVFSKKTSFTNSTFKKSVDFTDAEFSGEVEFITSEFISNVNFKNVKFKRETKFISAHFKKNSNFSKSYFVDKVDFSKVRFIGFSNFLWANFEKEVVFYDAIFFGRVEFSGVIFKDDAVFAGVNFLKDNESKKGDIKFDRVKFFKKAVFSLTICERDIFFRFTDIKGVAEFVNVIFTESLNLNSANFHSQVNFQGSCFSRVDFTGANFDIPPYMRFIKGCSEIIEFEDFVGNAIIEFEKGFTKITKEYYDSDKFWGVKKEVSSDLYKILINGGNYEGIFTVNTQTKLIELNNITFEGNVNIIPKTSKEKGPIIIDGVNFVGSTIFSNVKIEKFNNSLITDDLVIRDCDLTNSSFYNTSNLSNIDFSNCTWAKYPRNWCCFSTSLKDLNGLYDEWKLITEKDEMPDNASIVKKTMKKCLEKMSKMKKKDILSKLEDMYRQVASSYESRRRYGMAGKFKVGEYEMRKQNKKTQWLERRILGIYKFFSSYGESILKPLSLIFLTPLLSALGLMFFNNPLVNNYIISFNKNISLSTIIYDFWNLYVFSLQNIFQLSIPVIDISWKSKLILIFLKIFSAIFIALLLFAVRRKIKR